MRADSRLARLGLWLRAHQGQIRALQWLVVAVYLVLLILPALLPLPPAQASLLDSLNGIAQMLFWGLWWPGVILSVLLFGRLWCGLLCPEGMLSEWASQRGRGRRAPDWLRWPGWPPLAFALTTVYGQLLSVYQYPRPALLILGGSTVAAMAVGYAYARNKRIWCRYLCPVSGVFGLLARLAPLHYAVDRAAWDAPPSRKVIAINCAPLIDIRRMDSASQCHQCGRCAGQRDAVHWAWRRPGQEIITLRPEQTHGWEVALLLYGLIGTAGGAFLWSSSTLLLQAKQGLAGWLIEHERALWLLDDTAPWWLLTHYPQLNDSFSWLDGALILAYIALAALALGSWAWAWLAAAARLLQRDWRARQRQLAYCLTPLAGLTLLLGLSLTSFSQLRGLGLAQNWRGWLQGGLLLAGLLWSLQLAWAQLAGLPRRRRALLLYAPAPVGITLVWLGLLFGA